MTCISRSGIAALGAIALAAAVAAPAQAGPVVGPTVAKTTVAAQRPAAGQVARPAVAPAKTGKLRNRDRGSFNRPVANSAYLKLGLNKRFLQAGDTWTMAWSSLTRHEVRKAAPGQVAPAQQWGAPLYVSYQVTKVWGERLGNITRTLAKIRMTYARRPLVASSTFAELTVDHFWNPVSFRVASAELPYGKRQDKDTRRVIHGVGEFPLYVGDLENVPAYPVAFPRIIPALAAHRAPVGSPLAIKVNNGVNVHAFTYWVPGNVYASYVASQHHQGILVSQQLAR